MARTRSCIWVVGVHHRESPAAPAVAPSRAAPPAQAADEEEGDGEQRRGRGTAQAPASASAAGLRRGPSGAAIRRARDARAARGRRRRGFGREHCRGSGSCGKPADTALPGPAAQGAPTEGPSGRTSRRSGQRPDEAPGDLGVRASRAPNVPSGATARTRATIPKATMLRSRPRWSGRTATRALTGRGPRRVSLTSASRCLKPCVPKGKIEPATSASVSAQPEAERNPQTCYERAGGGERKLRRVARAACFPSPPRRRSPSAASASLSRCRRIPTPIKRWLERLASPTEAPPEGVESVALPDPRDGICQSADHVCSGSVPSTPQCRGDLRRRPGRRTCGRIGRLHPHGRRRGHDPRRRDRSPDAHLRQADPPLAAGFSAPEAIKIHIVYFLELQRLRRRRSKYVRSTPAR